MGTGSNILPSVKLVAIQFALLAGGACGLPSYTRYTGTRGLGRPGILVRSGCYLAPPALITRCPTKSSDIGKGARPGSTGSSVNGSARVRPGCTGLHIPKAAVQSTAIRRRTEVNTVNACGRMGLLASSTCSFYFNDQKGGRPKGHDSDRHKYTFALFDRSNL